MTDYREQRRMVGADEDRRLSQLEGDVSRLEADVTYIRSGMDDIKGAVNKLAERLNEPAPRPNYAGVVQAAAAVLLVFATALGWYANQLVIPVRAEAQISAEARNENQFQIQKLQREQAFLHGQLVGQGVISKGADR